MKKIALSFTAFALIAFIGCKDEKKDTETEKTEEVEEVTKEMVKDAGSVKAATFRLESKSESSAYGEASFTEENGMVTFIAKIKGLDAGTHAIHIHEKADCSSPDGTSSGGHWNPTFAPHGKWGDEGGFHKGDIGNFDVGEDGYGTIKMATDLWCVGCGDETKDVLGKAIVVHQGTDDFTSQPSGAAGARVSCGGIIQ